MAFGDGAVISRPRSLGRGGRSALLALVPLAFVGAFFLIPLVALINRAIGQSGGESIATMLEQTRAWHLLWFTVFQAGMSVLCTVVIGLPIAWLTSRVQLPGMGALRALVFVPFVLPTVVVGIAFRALLGDGGPLAGLGIDGTVWAIVAAHVFFNLAVVVRTVGSVWAGLDPRAVDAARTLGAGPVRAFLTVTLPALAPAIVSAASVVFLFCATSFGVVLMLSDGTLNTLETEIYRQAIGYFRLPQAVLLSLLQLAMVVVVMALVSRLSSSRSRIGVTRHAKRPNGTGWIPVIATAAAALVIVLGPIAVLVYRSLRPTVGGPWSLAGYRALGSTATGESAWHILRYSMISAVWAALLSLTVGLLAAVAISRIRGRLSAVVDAVAMLPLGVSAVTVGFGYLIVLSSMPPDVADSPFVVPAVQSVIALPLVVRLVLPALRAVDPRLRQAAATLGASPVRAWIDVDLRLVLRPIGAALGFAYVIALGEFGATGFVARPDTTTMPVLIGTALSRPGADSLALAMAASVVLMAVTVVVVGLIEALRGSAGGDI